MILHVERLIEPRHALEIDGAVKQTGAIEAASEHGPVKPILSVC